MSAIRVVLVAIGVALTGVGLVPADVSQAVHNVCSITAVAGFAAVVLAVPWLLRGLSRTFLVTSAAAGAAMVVIVLLWVPIGFYNLTAVELLAVLLLFAWLSLFARTIGHRSATAGTGPVPAAPPRPAAPPLRQLLVPPDESSDPPSAGPETGPGNGPRTDVLAAALLGLAAGSVLTRFLARPRR